MVETVGAGQRDLLMIYIRYKRITIDSLKNPHQKSSKILLHPLFTRRKRNPKTASSRVQNQFWPDYHSTGQSANQNVRSTAQNPATLQDLLEMSVDRPVDGPMSFYPLYKLWSTELSIDPNLVHVGRPPGRPKSCRRVLKTLSPVFAISLHSPSQWRFFKSEPNSNEHLAKLTRFRVNRHTISTWPNGPTGS